MNDPGRRRPAEADLVFNIVFTPGSFRFLHPFAVSLIAHSDLRFRLVANACPAAERDSMDGFAHAHDDRVVEVLHLPGAGMAKHGRVLDELYESRVDGGWFCFIDSDMKANGRFMDPFLDALSECAAVTSGRVSWSQDSVLPAGEMGVPGRFFRDRDGFVYGSSYMAIYRRAAVDDTRGRWSVGFQGHGWKGLPPALRQQLELLGRRFALYDTAKVLNILMQGDGHEIRHLEHDDLVHIGGMSAYLSSDSSDLAARGKEARHDFARFAAATLRQLLEGSPAPAIPEAVDPEAGDRFRLIRDELVDLVSTYSPG